MDKAVFSTEKPSKILQYKTSIRAVYIIPLSRDRIQGGMI